MEAPIMKTLLAALFIGAVVSSLSAQSNVTKEAVPGITNFARVETTVACAGAVKADAVPEIKKFGFASIINLREASEPGADVDAEAAAAKAVGLRFVHLPFNAASPDPKLVDNFLLAVMKPENQPAFIHCAGGGRAASLWLIKRVKVDGWDEARAVEEATALGLTDARKPFALNYIHEHR
jgi:uncharacterized protein (TIGR01244 family)